MKIFVINPNSSREMTQAIDASAKEYAHSNSHIYTACSTGGPRAIECLADPKAVEDQVNNHVREANKQGYDAIIMACYGQSLLRGAKSISRIPVYGVAEPQMFMACLLGGKFSVIGLHHDSRTLIRDKVAGLGLTPRCASIRTLGVSILEGVADMDRTFTSLVREAKKAVVEDGADVICLGCAGLAGLDKPMEREIGVPVLDPVVCAVKMCETLFQYGLGQNP